MADTLFDAPVTPEIDPDAVTAADLIGDGKKYADADAIAKAKAHADAHIARLTTELEDTRRAQSQGLTYQQFIDQMDARLNATPPPPVTNPEDRTPPVTPQNQPNVDALINEALTRRSVQEQEQANLKITADVLEANFGPGYARVLLEKGKALGLGPKTMDDLAKKNPRALLKLVDASEDVAPARSPAPGARANPGLVRGASKKNAAYFDTIRKSNPSHYFSKRGLQERLDAIKEIGEDAFYAN